MFNKCQEKPVAGTGLLGLLDAVCGGVTLLSSHQSPKCSGYVVLPSYTGLGVTNGLLSVSLYCG